MTSLTDEQVHIIDLIIFTSTSLGAAGALFIICSFLLFKQVRSFATRLMFFLSLSDLMASISWYPFGRLSTALCDLQAIGLHFFLCSSFFWTMCISISLFMIFYSDKFELQNYFKVFHMICWGIPLAVVIACFAKGKYGYFGGWCFISDPKGIFEVFYFLPLLVVLLVNVGVFIAIRVKIAKYSNSMEARMNIVVSFYLIAFVTSQLPAVLNTVQNAISPNQPIFMLYVFHALFQPLQGFLNCIVYGINEGFLSYYVDWFEKYLYRCRRRSPKEYEEGDETNTGLLMDYDYKSDGEEKEGKK
eukprot:TRINITY_DN5385_c0_g2_i2.p1 TRINITY_DN5385_c0_g2~~TRINITY_DN5385_c0_g2_i2.p1  ORF type:complete len:302 (-),score=7.28 TRINITY_DN5385_c0_g2_i2:24-929(-)